MDSELNVKQFSEVCRTCLSKKVKTFNLSPIPINATYQDNTVENLLRSCIPHVVCRKYIYNIYFKVWQ